MFNLLGRSKTLRPLKALSKDSRGFKLSEKAQASLGTGNMRAAVQLPPGEDLNEWLAVNTVDFFNETSLIYGTILEICSEESCPVMSAGELYQYYWMDGVNVKTPVKVSAPQYVDYLMTWVDSLINDESIFPLQSEGKFPKGFLDIVKTIFKRLFRVYAHIYHSHFDQVTTLGAEAHLNTCFKHFIFFVDEFQLVDEKELLPLKDLIAKRLKELEDEEKVE